MRHLFKRFSTLTGELKRRKVLPVIGVYIVGIWGVSQGVAELAPYFNTPDWVVKATVGIAFGLLPVVLVLAWKYDITSQGIKRDLSPNRITSRSNIIASSTTVAQDHKDRGTLIVEWQDNEGDHKEHFTEGFVMGRESDCDLRFWDAEISRYHAKVSWQNDRWIVTDLGSSNGTRLNGERITIAALPSAATIGLIGSKLVLTITTVMPESKANHNTKPTDDSLSQTNT